MLIDRKCCRTLSTWLFCQCHTECWKPKTLSNSAPHRVGETGRNGEETKTRSSHEYTNAIKNTHNREHCVHYGPPPKQKTFFVCVSLGNLYNKASWIGGRAKEAYSTFSLCHTCSAVFSVNFSGENWVRPSHYNQIQTCHRASPLAVYAHAFPAVFRQLERYTVNICVTCVLILYKLEVMRPERCSVSCVKPFTTRNKWETQYIKCQTLITHVGEKV